MNLNVKKIFELFLVLIIFYGVYSVFDQAAPVLFNTPNSFWVVITSLIAAALLLVLYAQIIASSAKKTLNEKVRELEDDITAKNTELKNAFKVKKAVEDEAEDTLRRETTF